MFCIVLETGKLNSNNRVCFYIYYTWFSFCNVQPSQATANPVGGKACSSTKGGLLRYIPNTYSIHKVSSLKFAYFQGRLSRHITSPSEKTRPESWPGDYMGKATPVWQLSLSHRCHQMLHISKGGYPVTLLPPPRRLVPSLGLGTTWVRQLRSGSCHYPTAATKRNEQLSQATANPVGGKACSSTKGGFTALYTQHLLDSQSLEYEICIFPREAIPSHYFPLREDSSRVLAWGLHGQGNPGLAVVIIPPLPPNVAYFQGRLSRHISNG